MRRTGKKQSDSWKIVSGSYFSLLLFVLFILAVVGRSGWFLLPAALVMVVVPVLDSVADEDATQDEQPIPRIQQFVVDAAPALFVMGNAVVIGVTAYILARLTVAEMICNGVGRHDRQYRHNSGTRIGSQAQKVE